MPRIIAVPGNIPFLDQITARWLGFAEGDPLRAGRGTIIVPGRRAARALTEAFLRVADGRALLLPRIVPVGDADEFTGAVDTPDLPPSVEPIRRLAVLSALILRAEGAFGTAPSVDQAWPLARALAELMDDAEWAECDLAQTLPDAADEEFARHWHVTLQFLSIVTDVWPKWLEAEGLMNPVARQVARLHALAARWRALPESDSEPVWAVGFTDAMPATAALLEAVSSRDQGALIIPGVDCAMAPDLWDELPESHPQAGIARLLADLGVGRDAVEIWAAHPGGDAPDVPQARSSWFARALLPAGGLGDWLADTTPVDLEGVSVQRAADPQQEASAIAMVLREAAQQPGRRAALVTPDRALAGRVAVELARWGIAADDSAGEPIGATPQVLFLRLIAQAFVAGFAPVSLLCVLKHPLAACGMSAGACRASARLLERRILRGPAPAPGIDGLRGLVERALAREVPGDAALSADLPDVPAGLVTFFGTIERCFSPLLALGAAHDLPDILDALVRSAESLAATDEMDGAGRLWAGEEGNAVAQRLSELVGFADVLPPQSPDVIDQFLAASFADGVVRGARGLGGGGELHPRIFIWGLMEARLQSVELMVLGGLVEGVWPPATDPGPWMSRPMRRRAGLPSSERLIGQAAHDFAACAACASEIILSMPAKRDGAPTVPARWIVRIDAFLRGRDQRLPAHPALAWQAGLDRPDHAPRPVSPPAPRPPVHLRPRSLSVTAIETWMRDPYAIYARHVLGLQKLPDLEEAADHSDYGMIVHDALDHFMREHPSDWPADAVPGLRSSFRHELERASLRPALAAWWAPRLVRIADWVASTEGERRKNDAPLRVVTECRAEVRLSGFSSGVFRLTGRADRIDLGHDGTACVFDYKTGTPPSVSAVKAGWSAQLPLEAAMILYHGFAGIEASSISGMFYWQLGGGYEPGKVVAVCKSADEAQELARDAWERLRVLIAAYDDPAQPYLSHPRPGHSPRFADYAQLARVAEWSAATDEGGA